MEGFEKKDGIERDEIFSKTVRAGKRTYFFDVKATKRSDYYLTITESKKCFDTEGNFHFEKHKLFLYKEDFDKFADGLEEIIKYIKENKPELTEATDINPKSFTNVEFDDLKEK